MASGEQLELYTYDYLLQYALSNVPDTIDKRQGSIIYDALAPTCYVLSLAIMELRNFYKDTWVLTATGEDLDNRVIEQGLKRFLATFAVKKGYFTDSEGQPMSIPIGARFSTLSDSEPLIYAVTAPFKEDDIEVPGTYELTCETSGILGNQYSGAITPIDNIVGIATAQISTLITPARDEEDDEQLRNRYLQSLGEAAFGGNIEDYREKCLSIAGVGAVQVYPIWAGGGTVKVSIIDTEYNICTPEFIDEVQTILDPEVNQGIGLGLAPIGHTVTVVTAEEVSINVTTTVIPDSSHTIEDLQAPIENVIRNYLLDLKRHWADSSAMNEYSCSVYIARITAAIVGVEGVANITDVKLNDDVVDIQLEEDAAYQQIPVLGTVTING